MKEILACGAEEPLLPNGYLLSLNEETGIAEQGRFALTGLNRYSFVSRDRSTDTLDRFTKLLQLVSQKTESPATWVSTWQFGATNPSIPARWILSKRTKQNWKPATGGGIAIACKTVCQLTFDCLYPKALNEHEWVHSERRLLLFRQDLEPEALVIPPVLPSLAKFTELSRFTPSKQFLEWLVANQRTVAYLGQAFEKYPALVIAGSLHLSTNQLVASGLVDVIESGENALQVWRAHYS
jgi:hypothetical protein